MAGRKPIHDLKRLKVGESIELTGKQAEFSDQYIYNCRKQGFNVSKKKLDGKIFITKNGRNL
jgi:hypothetical protein